MAEEFVTEPVKLKLKRDNVKLKNENIFPNSNKTEPLVSGEMNFSSTSTASPTWTNISTVRSWDID
jgi:hypothetical protein